MHHPQSEPGREAKLRAACDRCHDLKNRCARTGGVESRCDRCERLDIDCVYRTSSSMGRPKRLKKTPGGPARDSEQASHLRMTSDKIPEPEPAVAVAGAGGHELDVDRIEADTIPSESTTLADLPWDATSLLMSPEGPRVTEPYWGADFCNYNNTIYDPLFRFGETHQSPHTAQQGDRPENGGPSSKEPGGGDCSGKEPTAALLSRLFQLQGQLCRLLLAGDGQSGCEYVQEGLEVSKTFLEMLQAGSPPTGSSLTAPVVLSRGRQTNPGEPISPESSQSLRYMSENSPLREGRPDASPMNYIVVQQALTCYLYTLLLLDRVVAVLTSRAGAGDVNLSVSQESPAALHFGLFSLASQPALNNEMVLHLILRLVQHLQAIIQMLASKCNELVDDSDQTSTGACPALESSGKTKVSPASLAVVSHAMSDLVIKRERLLIGRLLSLTGAT